MAETLGALGAEHVWVVHGDGLDELTLAGETQVAAWRQGSVRRFVVTRELVYHPDEELRKLLAERKISLELTPAAKELVFTEGYDPNYGARPLKRAIQRIVQDPLAMKILDGTVLHGDTVKIGATKDGTLTFNVEDRKS